MSAPRTEATPKGPLIAVLAVVAWYLSMVIDLAVQVLK